ncbi:hypothetical protein AgCh_025736 [Apium graveolens]
MILLVITDQFSGMILSSIVNVDVNAANKYRIAVGNTPYSRVSGMNTLLVSVGAARGIVEANEFMRAGVYDGWLPLLLVENLFKGRTFSVIGGGRIGSAYASAGNTFISILALAFDVFCSQLPDV